MQLLLRTAVLAGIAASAVAGTALAANLHPKVMMVNLPDGLIAQVVYQGDVAPRVSVETAPRAMIWIPVMADEPLALLDQISADMDRQAAMMMRQIRALETLPAAPVAGSDLASFGMLPAGTVRYQYVATTSGNSLCSRSVEIISNGADHKPRVVSSTSGSCATGAEEPGRATNAHVT